METPLADCAAPSGRLLLAACGVRLIRMPASPCVPFVFRLFLNLLFMRYYCSEKPCMTKPKPCHHGCKVNLFWQKQAKAVLKKSCKSGKNRRETPPEYAPVERSG